MRKSSFYLLGLFNKAGESGITAKYINEEILKTIEYRIIADEISHKDVELLLNENLIKQFPESYLFGQPQQPIIFKITEKGQKWYFTEKEAFEKIEAEKIFENNSKIRQYEAAQSVIDTNKNVSATNESFRITNESIRELNDTTKIFYSHTKTLGVIGAIIAFLTGLYIALTYYKDDESALQLKYNILEQHSKYTDSILQTQTLQIKTLYLKIDSSKNGHQKQAHP